MRRSVDQVLMVAIAVVILLTIQPVTNASHPAVHTALLANNVIAEQTTVIDVLSGADALTRHGQYRASEQSLRAGLVRFTLAPDRAQLGAARSANYRAWSEHCISQRRATVARTLAARALAIDTSDNRADLPLDYAQLGRADSVLGDDTSAERNYSVALKAVPPNLAKVLAAPILNQLGLLRWRLGRYDDSLAALLLADAIGPDGTGDTVANNLGVTARALGDYALAARSFDTANKRATMLHHRKIEATATANLGATYHSLGMYEKAIHEYDAAMPAYRALNDSEALATLYSNVGYANYFLGRFGPGRASICNAVRIWRSTANSRGLQASLSDLGRMDAETGRASEAQHEIVIADNLARRLKDVAGHAICLIDLAVLSDKVSRPADASVYAAKALVVLRQAPDPFLIARAESVLMRADAMRHRAGEAVYWGKQAVNAYQFLRAGLVGPLAGTRDPFTASHAPAYRELASLLIDSGRLIEAQRVLQLLKQEELDEYDRDGRVLVRGERPPVRDGEVLVRGDRPPVRDGRLLVRGDRPPIRHGLILTASSNMPEAETIELTASERLVTSALTRATTPSQVAAACRSLQAREVASEPAPVLASSRPGPGEARISTLVTGDRLRVVLATASRTMAREYAIPQTDLNREVFQFRQALEDPASDAKVPARHMFDLLVPKPFDAALRAAGVRTIYWSLDGTLRYVPVVALFDGDRYMAERCSSTILSAGPPNVQGAHTGDAVLALGTSERHVSVNEASGEEIRFPALPLVPRELQDVEVAYPDHYRSLLDAAFTFSSTLHAIRSDHPKLIHVASHFHMVPGDSMRSVLLLGDGTLLSVHDISCQRHLFSGVDLVTLSACQTATQGSGSEVDGLAGVALNQGAKSVVATLWPVDDPGSLSFVGTFYRSRADSSTAEALRRAQATMMAKYAHPYYWAPYVLYVAE